MSTGTDTGEHRVLAGPRPMGSPRTVPPARSLPNRAADLSVPELVEQVARRRPEAVARVVQTLSGPEVHGQDTTSLLQRIAELSVQVIAACDSAGVTALQDGTAFTSAWTDERTLAVDHDQYDVDDGPCLHAAREGVRVNVTVAESMQAWPEFTRAAVADGVRSFLACPLQLADAPFGALNLYGRSETGFDVDDEAVATLISRLGTSLVAGQLQHHRSAVLISQLEQAIASRAVIEQAKGAVAVVRRITPDEAFGVLRTISQDSNVKLREVAAKTLAEFGAVLPA